MRPFQRLRRLVGYAAGLLLGAAALAGCSLSDYENSMKSQQARQDYLDEQNKRLAPGPITWVPRMTERKESANKEDSTKEGTSAVQQNEIFLRPPNGINLVPEKDPFAGIFNLYRRNIATVPFTDMLVAAAKTTAANEFREKVLKALAMAKSSPMAKPEVGQEAGRPLRFDYYHEPAAYLYFYGDQSIQVAIAFRPLKNANPQELLQYEPTGSALVQSVGTIDYSLETLTLGPPANKKFALWKKMNPDRPGPKINVAPPPPPPKL